MRGGSEGLPVCHHDWGRAHSQENARACGQHENPERAVVLRTWPPDHSVYYEPGEVQAVEELQSPEEYLDDIRKLQRARVEVQPAAFITGREIYTREACLFNLMKQSYLIE